MTTTLEKYRFWETNAYQIGGMKKEGPWTNEKTQQYTGAIALNVPGLPSHYGLPIGLQLGGDSVEEVNGSDMTVQHVAEEDVDYGEESIYGPEDEGDQNILNYGDRPESESEPVNTTIDDNVYDKLLKAVGNRRNKKIAVTHKKDSKTSNKNTKKRIKTKK